SSRLPPTSPFPAAEHMVAWAVWKHFPERLLIVGLLLAAGCGGSGSNCPSSRPRPARTFGSTTSQHASRRTCFEFLAGRSEYETCFTSRDPAVGECQHEWL